MNSRRSIGEWESVSEPRDVADFLAAGTAVALRGGGTKTALNLAAEFAVTELAATKQKMVASTPDERSAATQPRLLDLSAWSGVVEYLPSEYTITARAGTPLSHLVEVLSAEGQYLPFDPLLVEAGSTIGGAIATRANGPGRIRFGGVRDFLIGVQFLDGLGVLARAGGKVVKNAAGFDLPKFFCGSVGRMGVLTEASFKVFPKPESWLTLTWDSAGTPSANARFESGVTRRQGVDEGPSQAFLEQAYLALCRSSFEFYGLELNKTRTSSSLHVRLGGSAAVLEERAQRVDEYLLGVLGSHVPGERQVDEKDELLWGSFRELELAPRSPSACILKIGLTPSSMVDLAVALSGISGVLRQLYGCAGQRAFVAASWDSLEEIDRKLRELGLTGLLLRAEKPAFLELGAAPGRGLASRVKSALDPGSLFIGTGAARQS